MTQRVGTGIDVHAFTQDASRPLVLGGVRIADEPGLAGHSDADVVLHAVADALLGALALGDLGSRFGTADPAVAGADSGQLLADVVAEVASAGGTITNVDLTVVAERPRLATYREPMRERLAEILGLPPDAVSVKITSTDRLGAIGRGEGIACWASCLVSTA